jgi:hypothetical protein
MNDTKQELLYARHLLSKCLSEPMTAQLKQSIQDYLKPTVFDNVEQFIKGRKK